MLNAREGTASDNNQSVVVLFEPSNSVPVNFDAVANACWSQVSPVRIPSIRTKLHGSTSSRRQDFRKQIDAHELERSRTEKYSLELRNHDALEHLVAAHFVRQVLFVGKNKHRNSLEFVRFREHSRNLILRIPEACSIVGIIHKDNSLSVRPQWAIKVPISLSTGWECFKLHVAARSRFNRPIAMLLWSVRNLCAN